MSHNIETAKALIQQGFAIIPLKKYQKHNTDKNILERRYTVEDILNPIDRPSSAPIFNSSYASCPACVLRANLPFTTSP